MTYALDASVVLRLLDREAGWERVQEITDQVAEGTATLIMSALHWGEVIGILLKRSEPDQAMLRLAKLRGLELEIVSVTAIRAEKAASIRARLNIPYVNSFAVELALSSKACILLTADFDFKPAANLITIDFLPAKPKA